MDPKVIRENDRARELIHSWTRDHGVIPTKHRG